MKPLWCPARSNEDDDEEHLITQGGPGFPEKRGGADILAYRAEGAAPVKNNKSLWSFAPERAVSRNANLFASHVVMHCTDMYCRD